VLPANDEQGESAASGAIADTRRPLVAKGGAKQAPASGSVLRRAGRLTVKTSSHKLILFVATGVSGTDGGIASANRNVLAALQAVGSETGRRVRTIVLTEPMVRQPDYRAFGNDKLTFALATLAGLSRASLVVFDHVHLAPPMFALPAAFRPPIVICAHGSESARRIRAASIRAFLAADLVMANSGYTLGRMQAIMPPFRGVSCPLGLPPQFALTPAPPVQSDADLRLEAADGVVRSLGSRALLLVGRMDAGEREKGHREMMEAMPALADRFPEVQLVLAGGGSDLEPLRSLARLSPSASRIFLTGRVSDEALEALYRRAYAFAMPSRQEGFGLTYLEAMNQARAASPVARMAAPTWSWTARPACWSGSLLIRRNCSTPCAA